MIEKRTVAIIMLSAIGIAATIWTFEKPSAAEKPTSENPTVKTIIAEKTSNAKYIPVSGFLRGETRAELSPAASGRITAIFKHEGESVKRGEILATIDAKEINAQISATNANISALRDTLRDTKKYYDQLIDQAKAAKDDASDSNMPTDAAREAIDSAKKGRDLQVQSIQDQLTAAEGMLGIAQAGKGNFSLVAPFSGTILTINGHVGDFANFSMPLMSIATPGNLELETYVSATEGHEISVGNVALIKTSSGIPATGTVTAVSPGSDSGNFKTLAKIRVSDESGTMKIGDFVNASIMITSDNPQIEIPRQTIVSRGGDPIVFVVDDKNVAHEQPVKTGKEQNGLVVVLEGIEEGQNIVSEGQQYLINGITVSPYGENR